MKKLVVFIALFYAGNAFACAGDDISRSMIGLLLVLTETCSTFIVMRIFLKRLGLLSAILFSLLTSAVGLYFTLPNVLHELSAKCVS
jgi:hypothetical protein